MILLGYIGIIWLAWKLDGGTVKIVRRKIKNGQSV